MDEGPGKWLEYEIQYRPLMEAVVDFVSQRKGERYVRRGPRLSQPGTTGTHTQRVYNMQTLSYKRHGGDHVPFLKMEGIKICNAQPAFVCGSLCLGDWEDDSHEDGKDGEAS